MGLKRRCVAVSAIITLLWLPSSECFTLRPCVCSQELRNKLRSRSAISMVSAAPAVQAAPAADTFRSLYSDQLPGWLIDRLEELGFGTPTLVQQRAMADIMSGSDCVLHAQTGSGKTLAFLIPLFAMVDASRASVQGMVVVPTRELGLQVAAVAKRLAAATGKATGGKVMVMSVLEGSKNKRQRAWAWAEPPHIVIGNPDTLSHLVATGAIRCNAVRYVVIDEVDACLMSSASRTALSTLLAKHLSPTFAVEEEVDASASVGMAITGAAGPEDAQRRRVSPRQTVFASATVPQHNHFMKQCVSQQWTLTEPVHVQVHPKEAMPPSLTHHYLVCPAAKKLAALRSLVKRELGSSPSARALVFAQADRPLEEMAAVLSTDLAASADSPVAAHTSSSSTSTSDSSSSSSSKRSSAPQLAEVLREELGLSKRADAVDLFREGRTRVLLTTDMAARGLDIPEISHVFHFDLPLDPEGYIHRGGRAGRMGRSGKVVSIITPEQEFVITRLGNAVGVELSAMAARGGKDSSSSSSSSGVGDSSSSATADAAQ
jgi:superfamily II DNA/RNA helicase